MKRGDQFRAHRERMSADEADAAALAAVVAPLGERDRELLALVSRINKLPPTRGNELALRVDGAALYADLCAAIDGRWSMVGSANLDIRSFRLNYELNALVLSPVRAAEVEAIFTRDFADSREFARRPRRQKLFEAALRPFAPLL